MTLIFKFVHSASNFEASALIIVFALFLAMWKEDTKTLSECKSYESLGKKKMKAHFLFL